MNNINFSLCKLFFANWVFLVKLTNQNKISLIVSIRLALGLVLVLVLSLGWRKGKGSLIQVLSDVNSSFV